MLSMSQGSLLLLSCSAFCCDLAVSLSLNFSMSKFILIILFVFFHISVSSQFANRELSLSVPHPVIKYHQIFVCNVFIPCLSNSSLGESFVYNFDSSYLFHWNKLQVGFLAILIFLKFLFVQSSSILFKPCPLYWIDLYA